ncbi:hypothetical protein B0J14DRAFT_308586 [Halenospora varia]|nr:hypothetical protein B0J14DRAFT_308586 [Halenospora varia]
MLSHVASWVLFVVGALAVEPNAVYHGSYNSTNSTTLLRIGNGGAGQSGMVKALADAFIDSSVANGSEPFSVEWYTSDTTVTIKYLGAGTVDVGITYSSVAEQIAIKQGIALNPAYYAFRDHFLIVGPRSNPANIEAGNGTDVLDLFSQLHSKAEAAGGQVPVRFLSRYDKSATNIKESELWLGIGQVPWATAYSTWYHQYIAFPLGALTAAILLEEYTLTDRGTFLSLPSNLTSQTVIYKAATDNADDLLLNPARLLIGAKAEHPDVAKQFAEWVVGPEGQNIVKGFKKNGQVLYSPAP